MDKETADKWRSSLVDDVLAYLKIDLKELVYRMNDTPLEKNALEWENRSSIEDFYKTNKTQFWDEVCFNLREDYWLDHFKLNEVTDVTIMDFGCGIGSSALYLSQNNYVIGYDINKECLDFCNFRKERHNSDKISFTNIEPSIKNFDLVMAIDVLEHIPDLHELIIKWGIEARKNTTIYHASVFEDHPYHHPMHFDYTKDIERWFEEAGFETIGKRVAIRR